MVMPGSLRQHEAHEARCSESGALVVQASLDNHELAVVKDNHRRLLEG